MSRHLTGWRGWLLAVLAVALIAGISFAVIPSAQPAMPENAWVEHLPVDGKVVTCVFRSAYGISCDWENAQPIDVGSTTQPIAPPLPD